MYKLAAADTTVFCCNFTGNVAFSRFAVKTKIEVRPAWKCMLIFHMQQTKQSRNFDNATTQKRKKKLLNHCTNN